MLNLNFIKNLLLNFSYRKESFRGIRQKIRKFKCRLFEYESRTYINAATNPDRLFEDEK